MATAKDFILKNGLQVQGIGSAASISTTTGALTVAGGVGITGDLYARNIYVNNSSVLTVASIGSYGVTALYAGTDTAVSANTGTITVWNTSSLQSVTSRGATTPYAISITSSTDAISTTTGALIVTGGAGIGQQLHVGSIATIGENNANFFKLSGAASNNAVSIFATGTDATVNLNVSTKGNGVTQITSTLSSSTIANNALYVAGGLGVAGAVYGTNGFFDNGSQLLSTLTLNSGIGIQVVNNGRTGSQQSYTINNIGVTATIGTTYLGVSTSSGFVTFTNLGVQTLTAGTDTAVSASTGTITVWNTSTLQSITNRGAATSNAISISNATGSSTSTAGALTVSGGVGIGQNLNVGGSMNVQGPVTFSSPVTFNGTATYVLSTNTVYTDNLIEMHVPPGGVGTTWGSDDGKDIGLRFHYYNRTLLSDSNAALVLADDSQMLEWYGTGAESNTGTFIGASYGGFKLGTIQLVSTSPNVQSTNSGALQVAGGVGIGGTSYIGGIGGTASNTAVSQQALIINANGLGVNGASYFSSAFGLGSTLNVASSITAGSSLGVTGNLNVTGTSILVGNVTANSTLGVAGNFNVTGTSVLTGNVTANGNIGVVGIVTSTGLSVSGIFTSTNTSTAGSASGTEGAIQTLGGASIKRDLFVGGNLTVFGTINATINGVTSNAVTATNLSGANPGSIPYQLGVGQTAFVSGNAGQILVSGGTGSPIFQSTLALAGTTIATSTMTGALQVAGGVGIGGNLYAGGNLVITGTSVLSGNVTANNALNVNGNFVVTGTSVYYGVASITNTTQALSTNSGALTVSGGVSIGGNLYAGGNLVITGTSLLSGNVTAISTLGVAGAFNVTGTSILTGLVTAGNANFTGNVGITGTTVMASAVTINSGIASTSTTTGALVVAGGVGVGGSLWVNGDVDVYGTIRMQGVGLDTISGSTGTFVNVNITGTGPALVVTNGATFGGILTATTLNVTGVTTLGITTVSSLIVTGNETVNGNLGVTSNFNVTGTSVLTGNVTANSTLGVAGNFNVTGTSVLTGNLSGGSAILSGNLGVTGTSVLSGSVTIGPASSVVSYASASTTTTAVMVLDSFASSTYRTAKYVVQVVDSSITPNRVQVEEFLVFHDNGATPLVYLVSYGISSNNGELGTWDAVYSAGNISLQFTPNTSPGTMTVKTVRTSITL